jgi:hypothetical protein
MTHFSTLSRAAVAAAGAVLVLTLAGCSGGTASTGAPVGTAGAGTGAPGGTAATPSAAASQAPLAPLDAFFATMNGDKDAAKANQMKIQESIAACMTHQGFEYKPVVDSSATVASSNASGPQWGTKAYAEQDGYGMTASAAVDPSQADPVDPNQAAIDAMSDTEKAAYRAALHGTGNLKAGYSWQTAGCQGAAQHASIVATGMDENQYASLQQEMTALDTSITNDPRVSGVDAKWAQCMAGAGYTQLTAVGDAEGLVNQKVMQIKQAPYDNVDPTKLSTAKLAELDAEVKTQLSAYTPTEIKIAVADFTCRDAVKYTQMFQDVTTEYQKGFMTAHKAELDAWMASYLSTKK